MTGGPLLEGLGIGRVRQIAYHVPDVVAAARSHAQVFGSGPFFVAGHIPLTLCRHRGEEAVLDHSSAYGQWGELMIEFVQQNNAGPSVFRDMYAAHESGLHHLAFIVPDLDAAIRHLNGYGFETGLYAEVGPGAGFAMIDAVDALGHFIELYEPSETLLSVYETVRDAALNSGDEDVIRHFAI